MNGKKNIFILCLAICLFFSISCVCASDFHENATDGELTTTDDIKALGQENDWDALSNGGEDTGIISASSDDEIIGADDNSNVSNADASTYSELSNEIGSGGNIELKHSYYTYDSGSTITISTENSVIDGKGAIIDMLGSNIRALKVTAYVTIKNLTIKNVNYNGDGGAIYFSSSTVENCNFVNNTASGGGGAIKTTFGKITNCNFTNNAAKWGGAIDFEYYGTVTNCKFVNNTATNYGGHIYSSMSSTTADTCIFKTDPDSNYNVEKVSPTLNVDNFTTFYGTGEKLTFELKTNSGMSVYDGNISISVYTQNNDTWIGNYSCLSGEEWAVDLPVGSYYAIFNTAYAGFTPVNRTITINPPKYTFWALNHTINANSNNVINLTNDYYYDSAYDGAFTDGIIINRIVTINGNGYTIDSKGKARIFNIQESDVSIENLSIKNTNYDGNGGAIYFSNSGTVTNCNFTNNTASRGSAVYFSDSGTVENCNFTNNTVSSGGAVYFNSLGSTHTITNCNFTNNKATSDSSRSGAVYFMGTGEVINCNFTNNTAKIGGAIVFGGVGTVTNCNFTDNQAGVNAGAICFSNTGTVTNCNFNNNTANNYGAIEFDSTGTVTNSNFANNSAKENGGAVYFNSRGNGNGDITNCNFTGNNANNGSAIYFYRNSPDTLTISNSIFLNNRANAEALEVTKNENNITITFTGKNSLLNAIQSEGNAEVSLINVTYWGSNGITNTGSSIINPSKSNYAAGQNITVGIIVNDEIVLNEVKVTDENGTIVLNINAGENYYITVRHDADSYYTDAEKTISKMTFTVNVTSQTTTNKTVNITAKSNIKHEVMSAKLLFILPNGTEISANYTADGIWWAVYKFNDYGDYEVNASYTGLNNITITNGTITINKLNSTVDISDIVLDYGETKNVTVTTEGATGITAKINNTDVSVVNNYTIVISGLAAGNYTLTVTTIADADHNNITKNATITVNKLKTELTASAITTTYNINKNLVITLKDANGNPLIGVNVTVNLNGAKTYLTDKNGQVKVATKGLAVKTYTAKITFNANANYDKSTKDVKVTVKKAKAKITAKKKTFKKSKKVKKYKITLKNNLKKAMKKAKVTLKVKGKTYKAKTNAKGKAKFKIKNLKKKGTFKAKITYKGNSYYKKVTKTIKIKVKK